ncbi:MAG: hypothetical protein Roseis2KO_45600 [Roseivirga sp.]
MKELEDLAAGILLAMEENNKAFLADFFDTEAFADRIIIDGPSEELRQFNAGFLSSLKEGDLMARMLLENEAVNGSEYDFLRAYFNKKEGHLIFRLYGDDGMNYHDFLIEKIKGEYKMTDIYIYLTGEYLSETFSRLYLMSSKEYLAPSDTEGLPDLDMEDLSKVITAKGLVDRGEYEAAKEVISGLSEEVRSEKLFRLVELIIKSNLDDEGYLEVMENYKRSFPDDPSIYLMSIDYLILREEYEAARTAIDSLDQKLGGDSFLNLQRANIFYYENNLQKAGEFINLFLTEYNEHFDGLNFLLMIQIEKGQFDQAVLTMEKLIESHDLYKADLIAFIEGEPDYAGLAKSEAFKNWKKAKN